MKRALIVLGLLAALVGTASAAAGGKTVTSVLNGRCTEHDTLDANGALKSLSLTCQATGACKCGGATKLTYASTTLEPGNGASGKESGTLVAAGPNGTVTLKFSGPRSALGAGAGTWTLGKVIGYKGMKLVSHGRYTATTKTLSAVVGSHESVVRINASFGCWQCTGS